MSKQVRETATVPEAAVKLGVSRRGTHGAGSAAAGGWQAMSKKGERFASPSKVSLASAELLSSATRIPATTLEGIAPAPVQRATVTVLQAAEMLGISRSAAYEGVLRKEIPSLKIGRRVLVPKAALERLLAGEMR